MARPLTGSPVDAETTEGGAVTGRLDRSAARAMAAAISSLIVATLVVSQSSAALEPDGTIAGNNFDVGTVSLVDDDLGRSLVNLTNMAPRRPVEECIAVTYDGSIVPVEVSLAATTEGDLASYLMVEIERGDGGGYGSCDSFRRSETIYRGTLADLSRGGPLEIATLRNTDDELSFRFRFELADDERAVGQAASVDFVWEAIPR